MAIETTHLVFICYRCGKRFNRWKGSFPVSYAADHKGTGYVPVCRECVDAIYDEYLSECNNPSDAVRATCRRFNLYWNPIIYQQCEEKASGRTVMSRYLLRLTSSNYTGKCYDDSLREEGTMWRFVKDKSKLNKGVIGGVMPSINGDGEDSEDDDDVLTDEIIAFWGPGYTREMYEALEQRRSYWMSRFPNDMEIDIGTEAIIRQLCSLELDINRDRAAGRSADKKINTLNTLLGSAMLKPAQKKDDADLALQNTPMGVWLQRYEQEKPLPEVEDKLKRNKILKYIFTWMGHLCKMLGIKNGYTKLYEEEVERLRVERPEYDDEDEEDLLIDSYSEGDEDPDGDDL